jgi:hypothetical protein
MRICDATYTLKRMVDSIHGELWKPGELEPGFFARGQHIESGQGQAPKNAAASQMGHFKAISAGLIGPVVLEFETAKPQR